MSASVSTSFLLRRRLLRASAAAAGAALAGAWSARRANAADLASVTLVLGDQAGGTRALVEASRALEGTPYAFRWANFQGAAPLFEAQRAGEWALAHPQDYADVHAKLTRTPPDTALTITRRSALKTRFVSGADVDALQKMADVAVRDGILLRRLDVRSLADTSFGAA